MRISNVVKSLGFAVLGITAVSAQPGKSGIPVSGTTYVASNSTQKSPYQAERVYKLRLIPGSPVMVEIPMGETPENIWYDKLWWKS